ncbi:MAG TPA: hypothetical protein VGD95_05100 [Micavibrio sp.]
MSDNDNNLIYWLGGGLFVVMILVALSLWTPTTGPEDIAPAAGPDYVTNTTIKRTLNVEEKDDSDAMERRPVENTPTNEDYRTRSTQ